MSVKTGYAGGDIRRGDIIKIVDGKPDLEPAEPERRYERESPGEIIHIDIKKLGRFERVGHRVTGDASGPNRSRGAGWDFVHCIDDYSRVAFSEIKPDGRRTALFCFSKRLWLVTKALELPSRAS